MDRWLTDVMEAARCRLEVDMKNLNLFLVPRSPERPSADGLCSIINDSLCPEFPTCIFEAELPRAGLLDEETSYVCIAVDSSRPEKVKDMIKERLWVVRGNGRAPAKVEDVLHGRWSKKAPEFRLEDYGFFIPFRVMGKSEGVRTLSFHHRPTFYRYRVALTRVSRTPESLREYLLALFTSCPNHLFNRGTFRASGVRESSLDIEIPLQEMSDHEIVALARRSRDFEKVKSRHENVQKFLLERDPTTIATEVPVWVESWELEGYRHILKTNETLTGHIDVLRYESDQAVGVWDYKPNAADERCAGVQVFLYALMLSLRTGLPLPAFICGYFDEESAYVFKPSEVRLVYGS